MNHIKLPVSELKPALTGLSKLITRKPTLPVLGCVRVRRDSEGWVTLTGTDLDSWATVRLEEPAEGPVLELLVPLARLQDATRLAVPYLELLPEAPTTALLRYPIGGHMVEERVETEAVDGFPLSPEVTGSGETLADSIRESLLDAMQCASTDTTRYVINGACLDVEGPRDAGHYVVATDGKHLFSSNSFTLDLTESLIVPSHKFLAWKSFAADGSWKLTAYKAPKQSSALIRLESRRWTFICRAIDGNYPNWRQVVRHFRDDKVTVTLPYERLGEIRETLTAMPGADGPDSPVTLVAMATGFALKSRASLDSPYAVVPIEGATVKGLAEAETLEIRMNRKYPAKALAFGLNRIGLLDGTSTAAFVREGRQLVVMPLRPYEAAPAPAPEPTAQAAAANTDNTSTTEPSVEPEKASAKAPETTATTHPQPAGPPPQPERPVMPQTTGTTNASGLPNGHSNGQTHGQSNGHAPARSALDLAVEQVETAKESLRAALGSVTTLAGTLKAAVREQKTSDREVAGVRQTLNQLQRVRL